MHAIIRYLVLGLVLAAAGSSARAQEPAANRVGLNRGICVFLGLPREGKADAIVALAKSSELLIYVQSAAAAEVAAMRSAADAAGLLGTRIWVDEGSWQRIQMADNLADVVVVEESARGVDRAEVLRVLHPRARAILDKETLVKPAVQGLDPWSHPYHGPDNNPQSKDQVARYPYLTQFLAEPMFGCISEVSVAAGGRIFRAFGHIAFKDVQNDVLNTLFAINAHNGTILWQRPLKEGFMIHRNTLIATADTLYLGDDESCKLIDAATGKVRRELKLPPETAEGPVWKWMALEDGVLYALLGGEEFRPPTQRGKGGGFGGWPWGMWPGYDYKDPKTAFGFGRTLLAIDVQSGKVLWRHQEQEHLDGRAVCLRGGRLYAYSPEKFLLCLDGKSGQPIWKSTDTEALKAIGPNGRAQGYITGFATTCYMKCNDQHLLFAGPQRSRLAAISTRDGKLAWQRENGNLQLVLRDDALYAFGPQTGQSSRIDYASGKTLEEFTGRRACTRATGSVDSIFCRAFDGTIRFDPASTKVQHIAPMRPPCHDGVIISEGYLYWGPWICNCALSLFGHICLGPAGDFDFQQRADEKTSLEVGAGDLAQVRVAPANLTLTAGADGIVRATDPATQKELWKAYTGGGINFPPVLWQDRAYVGSNDGRVYAFEAATGRLLWRFRAAPEVRRIHTYGKLSSTWPVGGGVVVNDGVVYAAAGIAHYDGTHVYALDAVTGRIKWHNNSSGFLNPELRSGVSLQGKLALDQAKNQLVFDGGNAVRLGSYDLTTGRCLTPPPTDPKGVSKSQFYLRDYEQRRGLGK